MFELLALFGIIAGIVKFVTDEDVHETPHAPAPVPPPPDPTPTDVAYPGPLTDQERAEAGQQLRRATR